MYNITYVNQGKLVIMKAYTAVTALGYAKFLTSCGISCTVAKVL